MPIVFKKRVPTFQKMYVKNWKKVYNVKNVCVVYKEMFHTINKYMGHFKEMKCPHVSKIMFVAFKKWLYNV